MTVSHKRKKRGPHFCALATLCLGWATCLLPAGCVSGPEISDPPSISLPPVYSTSSATQGQPESWLDDFYDPQLASLVAEALAENANLARIAAVLDQSIAEARLAGADRLPSAGLGLNGARQQISTFGPSSTGGVIFNNYDLNLNLSWEVDLWGRLRDQSRRALASLEASQADLRAARLSLAAQITKSWFNLTEAENQVADAARTAQTYRENRRTLESRYARGLSGGLDLRRIRTIAASSEADLALRRRALDRARRSLEVLLGRYPAGTLESSAALPALPPTIPAGLPADLIQRRPDLVAAERRLAAADSELSARKKDLLPQISLTASGGSSSQEFKNLLDSDFSVWSLAGNLTQPIFQGGRILANIDRSASLKEQARAAYRDTALQAFLEVETALAAETSLKTEYTQLALASEEANAAEALAWNQYRNGTSDFLEVLDAQRTAASSRSRLIAIQNLLLQNRVDLYLALGGDFEPEP